MFITREASAHWINRRFQEERSDTKHDVVLFYTFVNSAQMYEKSEDRLKMCVILFQFDIRNK